ncbi:DUF7564 family protein [Haloferax larsenii]|uniref:Small CPxCG-related zinc finger protein n=1 Tax=Haloferax larsenii TaxID=302484 RepID=A0A1H7FV87_HALLR|nr:hypothetical protein [Haloferax larsenii]ELZ74998.1 hypothetical protein C455_16655 [Haloferax larsenii JCM 13917]UVE51645.1 hypothetical protein KU306_07165 [Haloferax larsenii]SEK30006.1 hypothetical protein SAMN04488691_101132 [Haloferax larsenii]
MTPSPVCISCGDAYLFSRAYKGNYCPDCNEEWSSKPRTENAPRPRPQSPASVSSVTQPDEDDAPHLEPPYDDE